jgi:hypothetical protein
LGRARIVKGLARELDAIAAAQQKGTDPQVERARLSDALAALVAYHNRSHERDPVVALEVREVRIAAPYDPSAARHRTVFRLRTRGAP